MDPRISRCRRRSRRRRLIAPWNQAEVAPTSRERRMRDGSSIAATKASAVSWPTPGIVITRRQAAEALVMRPISAARS